MLMTAARWASLTVLVLQVLPTGAVAAARAKAPEIRAVKAFLFNEETGQLDAEDFFTGNSNGGRWNDTTTGSMLVVVELAGDAGQGYGSNGAPSYSVRMTASNPRSSKQVFSATRPVTRLSEHGTLSVSFLIYPPPCQPLRLVAKVVGPGAGKAVEQLAGFACGE
jgi:hypothetical protein